MCLCSRRCWGPRAVSQRGPARAPAPPAGGALTGQCTCPWSLSVQWKEAPLKWPFLLSKAPDRTAVQLVFCTSRCLPLKSSGIKEEKREGLRAVRHIFLQLFRPPHRRELNPGPENVVGPCRCGVTTALLLSGPQRGEAGRSPTPAPGHWAVALGPGPSGLRCSRHVTPVPRSSPACDRHGDLCQTWPVQAGVPAGLWAALHWAVLLLRARAISLACLGRTHRSPGSGLGGSWWQAGSGAAAAPLRRG